jgi:probable selenium-dependent hydroxylase accessory protein YqeC
MKFYESLNITLMENELICFVGAGGKTTSLFMLAKELKACKKRVLVTTTTAIYSPDETHCDQVILGRAGDSDLMKKRIGPCICVLGREVSAENKILGVDKEYVSKLFMEAVFDYILVEADGSRQRPIKAPADHEPVIPGGTTKVVGVIGLDALGRQICSDLVHRPEHFCRLTGRNMCDRIDEEMVATLILSPEGLFKSVPGGSRTYVLFNKADNRERQKSAIRIIESLTRDVSHLPDFIIADILKGTISKVT